METLIKNTLGSLLRLVLGGLVAWLMEKGLMQPDQEAAFYAAIATALAAVAWAVWQNIIRQRLLNTAAALPPVAIDVVKAMVKDKDFAPATAPSSVVPNVQTPEERR